VLERRLAAQQAEGMEAVKGGLTPRTAQAAMRHSTIDLTMNVYTDPKLLDVAGGRGIAAESTARGWSATGSRRRKCNGHRRFDPFAACTNTCTN